MNTTEISKFLSYVLRHQPEAIGLTLNAEGWADIEELITGAAKQGKQLDLANIQIVVNTNDKKRFSISEDGLRIRAVQGHSATTVSINYAEKTPPEFLYHGTAIRFMSRSQAPAHRYLHNFFTRPKSIHEQLKLSELFDGVVV